MGNWNAVPIYVKCFLNDTILFTVIDNGIETNIIYDVINMTRKLSWESKLPD